MSTHATYRALLSCPGCLQLFTNRALLATYHGYALLWLQLFTDGLGLQPSSPRMRPLHFDRQLHTRRLALMALANLCDAHLAVQVTVVAHGALPQLVGPLRRHNAAVAAAEAEAKAEAGGAIAAATRPTEWDGAALDEISRQHLLRCLANLSLNEANHSALLGSQLLIELPAAATRGNPHEQRHVALLCAAAPSLAPRPTHP